ncbi:MAG: hypothetical protein K0R99_680 [Microbacterium sp.]|uniref:hypothetical protein n=1 Tax=Microbacterium sp. TaxID=51671 RepID=UPI00262CC84C|nr:hypothetical protein [Microbacterium sp.]MDF2559234.1 hypothetical protein [Microbacterium sp.]
MTKNIWTIIGVVLAVVIACSVLAFIFKLAIVAVVAVLVFLVIRGVFSRSDD